MRLRRPRPRTQGLRRKDPALRRQALLHPQPAPRPAGLEDRRSGRSHRRGRGPRPGQGHAGLDTEWNRRAGSGSTGHRLRDSRRRGVPAIRPQLETLDPQGQPELLQQPYSAVVRRTPDRRHRRPRRPALVRVAPQYPGVGGPVGPHPVCHHAPGRGLRLPAGRNQSVRGHQAISAPGAGAFPVNSRNPPTGRGTGTPGNRPPAGYSDHTTASPHRMPQGRSHHPEMALLPRGQAVPARQQDGAAHDLAFLCRTRGPRQLAPHGSLGLPLAPDGRLSNRGGGRSGLVSRASGSGPVRSPPSRSSSLLREHGVGTGRDGADHRPAAGTSRSGNYAQIHPSGPTRWCARRSRPSAPFWRVEDGQ